MNKLTVITIVACLAVAGVAHAACDTISFEDIATGTSVTGPYAISPYLSIAGHNMQVVEEGAVAGVLAFQANENNVSNSFPNWIPGDTNVKSIGNASTDYTVGVAGTEDLTITFNPDIVVTSFSISMYDYGDWFPAVRQFGTLTHTATLTGYENGGGSTADVLTFTSQGSGATGRTSPTYGPLSSAGDVWQSPYEPGRYTFTVSGNDLSSVALVFTGTQSLDPGVTFDNLEICYSPRTIAVDIDIKPTSCPNPLNVNSGGVLPVAILGTDDFDVSQIDPASVYLEGVAPLRWALEDVTTPIAPDSPDCTCSTEGPDGYTDLTLKFDKAQVVAAIGPVEDGDILSLSLSGVLKQEFGGTAITGEDCVVIVKKGKPN